MSHRHAADDIGPERGPVVGVLCHTCTKLAVSGSAVTSLLSRKVTSPCEELGSLPPPLALPGHCFGG